MREPKLPSREPDLGAPGASGRRPLSDLTPEAIRRAIGAPPPAAGPVLGAPPLMGVPMPPVATGVPMPSVEPGMPMPPSVFPDGVAPEDVPERPSPADRAGGVWAQAGQELAEMRRTGDAGGVVKMARRIYFIVIVGSIALALLWQVIDFLRSLLVGR